MRSCSSVLAAGHGQAQEPRRRGQDILIAVVDGLKGFPDAITAVFPQAQVQTCIVRLPPNHLYHERDRGLDAKLRRAVRMRGHFPSDEAALEL